MSVASSYMMGSYKPLNRILKPIPCQIIRVSEDYWYLFTFQYLIELGKLHDANRDRLSII